jgi:hypothetical protein
MASVYRFFLQTGSGGNQAKLTFSGQDKATITYRSNWMGSGPKQYTIRCSHQPLSALHGTLKLTSIRFEHTNQKIRMDQLYKIAMPPDLPKQYRAIYRWITYEYLKLPESQVCLPGDPELQFMKYEFFHLADWNEKFDLILLLHFATVLLPWGGELENHEIGRLLHSLDKLKFQKEN